jgi:hypothetical protein
MVFLWQLCAVGWLSLLGIQCGIFSYITLSVGGIEGQKNLWDFIFFNLILVDKVDS